MQLCRAKRRGRLSVPNQAQLLLIHILLQFNSHVLLLLQSHSNLCPCFSSSPCSGCRAGAVSCEASCCCCFHCRHRDALHGSGEGKGDSHLGRAEGGKQSRAGGRMGSPGVSEGSPLGRQVFLKGLQPLVLATCCNFPSVCI